MFRLTTNVLRMNTPEAISARLAVAIAEAIKIAGLSQRDVADRCGIPLVTLSRRLTGRTPFTIIEVAAICNALGISLIEIAVRAERIKDAA